MDAITARFRTIPTWAVLAICCAAQFMVVLDVAIVNVALPQMRVSLGLSVVGEQWVVNAYTLTFAGFLMLGGRAADLFGRRRIFIIGLTVFTVCSLLGGLAQNGAWLIAARAAQGLGGAILAPATLSILVTSFTDPGERRKALGAWSATAASGAAVGVLAGGILTTWLGWRSVFLVNVPVGVVAGLLSVHLLARDESRRGAGRKLDLAGATLAVAGLVTLAYALAGVPAHGWGAARTLLLLAVAFVMLAAFGAAERSVRWPLVPTGLWRDRSLVASMVVMLGATGILVGTFFLNSLYLQDVQGVPALRVGLEFLPLTMVIGAGAHLASRLLPRAGSRVLIVAGLVVMGAGAFLLTSVSARSGYLTGFLPGLLVVGTGTGLVFPATTITAMSHIAKDRAGLASGLMTAAHEIGAALGVAMFSAVAVAADGGITAGYRHGFTVAAAVAGGLAVVAALLVPAVRPEAGARVAVH
jgi:EmrB/QacA subfamily drug resistance transporter